MLTIQFTGRGGGASKEVRKHGPKGSPPAAGAGVASPEIFWKTLIKTRHFGEFQVKRRAPNAEEKQYSEIDVATFHK